VQEVELTWADKLMEKGREEGWEKGREKGVIEGKRKTLLRLLAARFGELPKEVTARAEAMAEVNYGVEIRDGGTRRALELPGRQTVASL